MADTATIGHNQPPAHLAFIQEADDLKTEAKNWLDGSDITTDAEAEGVALLINMATGIEKRADTARKTLTQPLDDQKKVIMDDFRPVGTTCDLIKAAAKKAMTKWLAAKEAEKRAAEEAERRRLAEERARIEAASRAAQSLEEIEAQQQAVEDHLAAEKALERAAKATTNVSGAGRTIAMRTVYGIAVTDEKKLAAWFWLNRKDDLVSWMEAEALKQVRACQGNTAIDGVEIISEKVAV